MFEQKKILVILEAGDALPSGIVRGLIYKDLFLQNGYKIRFINRLSPWLVKIAMNPHSFIASGVALTTKLFPGSKGSSNTKRGLINKLTRKVVNIISSIKNHKILAIARSYDIIYMSKVRSFELVKLLKENTKARIIEDFGDAIWLPGRQSNKFFDIEKFNLILSIVDAVTTDNEFTAAYAKKFNNHVIPIPDYPQTELFDLKRSSIKKDGKIITIGWIGSPNTVYNLYVVWEALEEVFRKHKNIHLRLVGTGHNNSLIPEFENISFSKVPSYDQNKMIEEVLRMDIGLFPLQNTEASKVRGILKAGIYMSGEVAVIASPIGQSMDFIRDGENGMLASTKEEWIIKLSLLIENNELRKRIAFNGLNSVKEELSIEKCFKKLITVFES